MDEKLIKFIGVNPRARQKDLDSVKNSESAGSALIKVLWTYNKETNIYENED